MSWILFSVMNGGRVRRHLHRTQVQVRRVSRPPVIEGILVSGGLDMAAALRLPLRLRSVSAQRETAYSTTEDFWKYNSFQRGGR